VFIPPNSPLDVYLSEPLSFAPGEDTLEVTLLATDALGKQSTAQFHYTIDRDAPVINIDQSLLAAPQSNAVDHSPYTISGHIIDAELTSVWINGKTIPLSPTPGVADSVDFDFSIPVPPGQSVDVSISAHDSSGHETQQHYILHSTSDLSLAVLSPQQGSHYTLQQAPQTVSLAARIEGDLDALTGHSKVQVALYHQGQLISQTTLAISAGFATDSLELPADAGQDGSDYELRYSLYEGDSLVSQTQRWITVSQATSVELMLERMEPANMSDNNEPNAPIKLYFNQPVELDKISLVVKETLHGKTWINSEPKGGDFIDKYGPQLQTIHREFKPVAGALSVLNDDLIVEFSPTESFGFNAQIHTQLFYDGQLMDESRFHIRPLPTLVMGSVTDNMGQSLAGIPVSLTDLKLHSQTNHDGSFSFGFKSNQSIPGGTYQLAINPADPIQGHHNPRYGNQAFNITLQQGRKNKLMPISLQIVDNTMSWQALQSGASNVVLSGGDLRLDLSDATIHFNNNLNDGSVQTQFVSYDQIRANKTTGLEPLWMFATQPRGLQVQGRVGVDMIIPQYAGSYEYLPDNTRYVMLLGYDFDRQSIMPLGVGQVEHTRVKSVKALPYTSLDYIGYALLPYAQDILEALAQEQLTLAQAMAQIQARLSAAQSL